MGLRDAVKAMSPTWMQDGVAEKYLYDIGLAADAVLERLNQAMRLHMPGYGDRSALPIIGDDRLIRRGLLEPDSSYIARLKAWLDAWRFAGSSGATLRQLFALLASLTDPRDKTPGFETVTDSGLWDVYPRGTNVSLPPAHYRVDPSNWNWDGDSKRWRYWLVVTSGGGFADPLQPAPQWAPPDTGATWDDPAYAWGVSLPAGTPAEINNPSAVVQSIRNIVSQWKGAHSWCAGIIISYDINAFDPTQPQGGGVNPDGTWGDWYIIVNNEYVQSRSSSAEYCDGVD